MTLKIELLPAAPAQECLDKVVPIENSMSGHNSYYIHCDIYHGRSNFAVCQHTIVAVQEKRTQLRSECGAAVECGNCPALAMRKAEQEAGRALYYIDRRPRMAALAAANAAPSEVVKFGKPRNPNDALRTSRVSPSEQQAWAESIKRTTVEKTKKEGIDANLINTNLAAEAVNALMEE